MLNRFYEERFDVHIATFRGRHNIVKSRVFLVLGEHPSGISIRSIVEESDANYDSLRTMLPRWVRWRYVLRRQVIRHGRKVFAYRLAVRGRRFIQTRIPSDIRSQLESDLGLDWQPSPEWAAGFRARLLERARES